MHPSGNDDTPHRRATLANIYDRRMASPAMCNLYSMTTPQAAVRALARVMNDRTGNMPPLPASLPTTWRRSFAKAAMDAR